MERKNIVKGHLIALATVMVWGNTFISTKVLLKDFLPEEILCYRFVMGLLVLGVLYPRPFRLQKRSHEFYFALAGLTGVTLYYLMENIALTYSTVSNVGVLVSVAPFFTAIFAHMFLVGEKLKSNFFIGFVISMIGIIMINFNGSVVLQLNPLGDLLAILAAIVWAVYTIVTRKISTFGYPVIPMTRRIFLYGTMFMLPSLFFVNARFDDVTRFLRPVNILNLLFLGILASAICFATWNLAIAYLGAVRSSNYIYIIPVVAILTSVIFLKEKITLLSVVGTASILTGLIISEKNRTILFWVKEKKKNE